jgi:hypothetical protein
VSSTYTWSHWTKQVAAYPRRPVTFRRGGLSLVSSLVLLGVSAYYVWVVFWRPDVGGLTLGDWYAPLTAAVVLGGFYLCATASLEITDAYVVVHNPLRSTRLALGSVVDVSAVWHLFVRTSDGSWLVWAVDVRDIAVGQDWARGRKNRKINRNDRSSRRTIAEFVREQARRVPYEESPPVIGWRSPGLVFWVGVVALVGSGLRLLL